MKKVSCGSAGRFCDGPISWLPIARGRRRCRSQRLAVGEMLCVKHAPGTRKALLQGRLPNLRAGGNCVRLRCSVQGACNLGASRRVMPEECVQLLQQAARCEFTRLAGERCRVDVAGASERGGLRNARSLPETVVCAARSSCFQSSWAPAATARCSLAPLGSSGPAQWMRPGGLGAWLPQSRELHRLCRVTGSPLASLRGSPEQKVVASWRGLPACGRQAWSKLVCPGGLGTASKAGGCRFMARRGSPGQSEAGPWVPQACPVGHVCFIASLIPSRLE